MIISRIGTWCAQRVSSLGLVALIILLYLALWQDRPRHVQRQNPKFGLPGGKIQHPAEQITTSQLIFVWYTLLAHLLALAFPLRLCYATWTTTRKLKRVLKQTPLIQKLETKTQPRPARNGLLRMPCEESSSSSSDSEEETISFFGSKSQTPELLHAIILPNYKEELDTLRETLLVLGSHPQAKSTYEIYLAMESTESGCQVKAKALTEQFKDFFLEIEHTVHPSGLPGEFQGKSSNLCWAAKHINQKYETAPGKRKVIVTVLDADSHLSANHFTFINDLHVRYPLTAETTMYVPPIIFDRNSHLVPTPVRLADLLWAGAGLSGHYESSTICPPTSVYSLPLSLVDRAGGWDAGPEAIGEDLHMYIKCFFALNGNLTVRTIFSAASQTNVHTGDPGIRGFYRDCNARYRQALRHMWGALDSGFVLKSVSKMWWEAVRGQSKLRPHWTNTLILAHRMYEAHFLPTHMTLLIVGGSLFMLTYPPTRIPPLLFYTLNMTAYLRICSLFNLGLFFFLYEPYHKTCVRAREQEMQLAGLHDRMADAFSYRSFKKNMLDYLFFPVAGIAFSSIPTMVALTCHFYTLKLVYKVSKKPSWVKAAVSP